MSKVAVRLSLPVVIVLALAACSGADRSRSVEVAGTVATAPPPTGSTTAGESPQAPGQDNRGVSVASLPIGDPTGFALAEDGSQCVHVKWIRSVSIPQGLGVLVTGATFVPAAYRLGSFPCEMPPCAGHVFRGTDLACDLAIRPLRKSETSLLNDPQVIASLTGQVLCADLASDTCRTFTGQVRVRAQELSLKLPAAPVETRDNLPGADLGTDTPPNTPTPGSQGEAG